MILQIYCQIIAAMVGIKAIDTSIKGLRADEKNYLQYNLSLKSWAEEEKKIENDISFMRRRKCNEFHCKSVREKEKFIDGAVCFYHYIFEYSNWLRNKFISAEVKREELKELIKEIKIVLQVIKDTHEHSKSEWEVEKSETFQENEDYEVINKEVIELEKEREEWENVLQKLETKLNSLQGVQTHIVIPHRSIE